MLNFYIKHVLLFFFSLFGPFSSGYAWNAFGHLLVAQIASDYLDVETKKIIERDNAALNHSGRHYRMVEAAVWLDEWRFIGRRHHLDSLSSLHYIDLPYSPQYAVKAHVNTMNAIFAIKMAQYVLEDKYSSRLDRGLAIRILWHVVADLHQPMHCISRFDSQHRKGDFGGTRYRLKSGSLTKNLHAYWDIGGGLLTAYDRKEIPAVAKIIETHWPCRLNEYSLLPHVWAKESYDLAKQIAYQIPENTTPNSQYQDRVAATSAERIAIAGCRLARLTKQVYATYHSERA